MARLLTLGGEEICSLAHLEFHGEAFSADVAPLVAARSSDGEALLSSPLGEVRPVAIDAWEIVVKEGQQIGRVYGRLLPPRASSS